MEKKKIIATIVATVMTIGLSVAGISAISAYADGTENAVVDTANPTNKPGTTTPGTTTPGTETPGTTTPGQATKPGTTENNRVETSKVTADKVVSNGTTYVKAEGTQLSVTSAAIAAAGTGSIDVEVAGGDVKAVIPAAILALGNGDVTFSVEEVALPTTATGTNAGDKLAKKLFELELKDDAGNLISDFKGYSIQVSLDFDKTDLAGLNAANLKAFHFLDGKVNQWFATTVNGTQVTFNTTHFSTFGAGTQAGVPIKPVANKPASNKVNGTKTGDANNMVAPIAVAASALVLVVGATGSYVLKKRKAN